MHSEQMFLVTRQKHCAPVKNDSEGGPGILSSSVLRNRSLKIDHRVYNGKPTAKKALRTNGRDMLSKGPKRECLDNVEVLLAICTVPHGMRRLIHIEYTVRLLINGRVQWKASEFNPLGFFLP